MSRGRAVEAAGSVAEASAAGVLEAAARVAVAMEVAAMVGAKAVAEMEVAAMVAEAVEEAGSAALYSTYAGPTSERRVGRRTRPSRGRQMRRMRLPRLQQ